MMAWFTPICPRRACPAAFLALAAALLAALLPAAPTQAQTNSVLDATLTVDESASIIYGCSNNAIPLNDNNSASLNNCSSSSVLTEDAFIYSASNTYSVNSLWWHRVFDQLFISFSNSGGVLTGTQAKNSLGLLMLNVDGRKFALSKADVHDNYIYWSFDPDSDWKDGQEVSVSLSLTATPPAKPTNFMATAGNEQVTLKWDKSDDASITHYEHRQKTGSTAYGAWFDIPDSTATMTTYTVSNLTNGTTYEFQVRAVNAKGNGVQSDPSGPVVPKTKAMLVLAASSIAESGSGNLTRMQATLQSAVTSVVKITITVSPPGKIKLNSSTLTIPVGNTRSNTVTIIATDNDVDAPDATVTLHAELMTSAPVLVPDSVTLTVRDDDPKTTGPTGPTSPTGSTGPAGPIAPTVSGLPAVTSNPGGARTYRTDERITVTLTFTQAIAVTGTPQLTLRVGTAARRADCAAPATDATKLVCTYTVVTGDLALDGIAIQANQLALNGGTLTDADGNAAALAHAALALQAGHTVDTRGVTLSATSLTVSQGGTATYTVRLATAPTGRVTITSTSAAPSAATVSPATLTFTPANWDTTQTVTVTGVQDTDESVPVTHTVSGGGYTGVSAAVVTLTIHDQNRLDGVAQQWLARFGRTIASGLTESVGQHLLVPATPGSHLVLGGQRLDLDDKPSWADMAAVVGHGLGLRLDGLATPAADVQGDPRWPRASAGSGGRWPAFTPARLLTDSAFHLTMNKAPGTGWLGSGQWAAWGRGAVTRFSGQAGSLALNDGEVLAGTLGVDYTQGPWLGGLAVAYNHGTGTYADAARQVRTGELRSTLTSVHPYLRWAVQENLDVWGLLGYGWGDLELTPAHGRRVSTDMALQLGAVGVRGTVARLAKATLALKADAFLVTLDTDEIPGLPEVEADAHRVRLVLEGTYTQTLAAGRQFTPTLELGLRQDGGDAETGLGVELGGGLRYTDPYLGLTVEGRGRVLLAHAESAYKEWGASGAARLDPGADGRGLAFALRPAYGATGSRMASLWGQEITALAPGTGGQAPTRTGWQVQADLSYGFAGGRARDRLTPYGGVTLARGGAQQYRLGGRLGLEDGLSLNLEGSHQVHGVTTPADTGLLLRLEMPW